MHGEARSYGLGFERRRQTAIRARLAAEPWSVPVGPGPRLGNEPRTAPVEGATPRGDEIAPPKTLGTRGAASTGQGPSRR